ncbi:uncharacterized protein BDR25DRAFT_351953 [Lindgomyces ingoldianus]|uniref:Uncharacterized protein n=1 Tax=Lindgomyces ingoldianus TaxID=673940 RepID=A0ACB6R7V8_9PLEO|nr:uncharacterized protein BDR25DRAFT_351953 [Lindgomyces ingoldianus]KAF2474412.1 hypothetical protein BDR25DRAFT_351953 [Lindgomyces ingoldianus]
MLPAGLIMLSSTSTHRRCRLVEGFLPQSGDPSSILVRRPFSSVSTEEGWLRSGLELEACLNLSIEESRYMSPILTSNWSRIPLAKGKPVDFGPTPSRFDSMALAKTGLSGGWENQSNSKTLVFHPPGAQSIALPIEVGPFPERVGGQQGDPSSILVRMRLEDRLNGPSNFFLSLSLSPSSLFRRSSIMVERLPVIFPMQCTIRKLAVRSQFESMKGACGIGHVLLLFALEIRQFSMTRKVLDIPNLYENCGCRKVRQARTREGIGLVSHLSSTSFEGRIQDLLTVHEKSEVNQASWAKYLNTLVKSYLHFDDPTVSKSQSDLSYLRRC